MSQQVRAEVVVSGRVQGVFFRASAQQEGLRLGLTGEVSNLPDGSVEAIVEGESGFLVPAGNDQIMAERIIALINNPARAREMGQLGKSIVEQKFGCEHHLRNTLELYDELLSLADRQPAPIRQSDGAVAQPRGPQPGSSVGVGR